jgi:hypothetical protein
MFVVIGDVFLLGGSLGVGEGKCKKAKVGRQ